MAENVRLNTYTAGKEEFVRLEAEHWDNRVTKLKKRIVREGIIFLDHKLNLGVNNKLSTSCKNVNTVQLTS